MTTTLKFDDNGWRHLSSKVLEHVSGLKFEQDESNEIKVVQSSVLVFIKNLKNEGVSQEQAERLLEKLSVQVKAYFSSSLH
ncbi:MAG: hypothetical protein GX342_09785 [Alcaligenaceae bacterium]|jgi:hypothetical protein|nr:hypothetical protein [Alcaligenaceae bacterium]